MNYIIGSNNLIAKKIKVKKKFFKNCVYVSTKKTKNFLQTNIFKNNFNLKKEKWITRIKPKDRIIFLSNLGKLEIFKKKNKVTKFEKNLEHNFFLNLNKNVKFIFFSTDYVYSGKKKFYYDDDKSSPLNDYGKNKIRIEKKIKKYFNNYLIIRIPKIYSLNLKDNTIFSDIYNNLKMKKKIKLITDQNSYFLNIENLIKILNKLIKNKVYGVYNIIGDFYGSRFDFGRKIVSANGLSLKYLIQIKRNSLPVKIPKNLNLKSKLFRIYKFNFIKDFKVSTKYKN